MVSNPRVVIVGGGFGGLAAARALAGVEAQVTLVDRLNHHLFQPLLYQVATAALSPSNIGAPLRHILRKARNIEVLLADATGVDVPGRRLLMAGSTLPYDYLIVASGATHAYLGHPEWAAFAPGLKNLDDALGIRSRVLLAFEAAEREHDAAVRERQLTFAIVGGGPTGVELAGAIAGIARQTLAADFRTFSPKDARVLLVESGPRLLPSMSEASSEAARKQLVDLGVAVNLGQPVTAIDAEGITLGGKRVPAATVLWAAGVQASKLGETLGAPLDKHGRVQVLPDLSLPNAPEVFVIGDLASLSEDGHPIPGVAPAAMQEGRHAALSVRKRAKGEATVPFHYRDKGTIATVGRGAAVADLGRLKLSGLSAWLAWLFVHTLYLVGFRNRLSVLFDWAWLYVTFDRGARIITHPMTAAPQRSRSVAGS